ncbi:roadblock/LC7 domain-containing protein [bacterium]|nr:roadblock/LC7 domain-containing protein [bacterium]
MKQLGEILDQIADGPAIRFAAIVSRDGFIIGNSSSAGESEELAAARAAQLIFAADGLGEELSNGGTKQIVVKYHNGLLVVDCLNSETLLLTAVASEASMAWVQYAVKKCLPEINQRL